MSKSNANTEEHNKAYPHGRLDIYLEENFINIISLYIKCKLTGLLDVLPFIGLRQRVFA